MIIKTGAFCDERCTCPKCGNTHELYGGKGYEATVNEFYPDDRPGFGEFVHVIKCRVCGAESVFRDKD